MIEAGGCALAVDAGGTFLKFALMTLSGDMIGETAQIPVNSGGTAASIEESFRAVARLAARRAAGLSLILRGVGVSTPGPFDYAGGRYLMDHKYEAVRGVPIRPWFTGELGGIPVCFVHDSTACMLGLLRDPGISRFSRVAAVMLGTGLGFSLCVDGSVLQNPQGGPAVSLFRQPYREGVAEDYVSRRGILARYRAAVSADKAVDVADIAGLARGGGQAALAVFRDTGTMLGEILRPVLTEYGVTCLVACGQISRSFDLFERPLREALSGVSTLEAVLPAAELAGAPLRGAFIHLMRTVSGVF